MSGSGHARARRFPWGQAQGTARASGHVRAAYDPSEMLASRRRHHDPAADLARVLACWLVVILFVQGLAALQALVRGPAHRHVTSGAWGPATHPAADAAAQARGRAHARVRAHMDAHAEAHADAHVDAHAHAHARGEAHHHAADEVTVPAGTEAGLDAAACVLIAVLAALPVNYGWAARAGAGVPFVSAAWAFVENDRPPPRRPPRS